MVVFASNQHRHRCAECRRSTGKGHTGRCRRNQRSGDLLNSLTGQYHLFSFVVQLVAAGMLVVCIYTVALHAPLLGAHGTRCAACDKSRSFLVNLLGMALGMVRL